MMKIMTRKIAGSFSIKPHPVAGLPSLIEEQTLPLMAGKQPNGALDATVVDKSSFDCLHIPARHVKMAPVKYVVDVPTSLSRGVARH